MLVADTSQHVRITLLNALRSIRFSKRFGWRQSEYYAATRGGDLDTTQCRRPRCKEIRDHLGGFCRYKPGKMKRVGCMDRLQFGFAFVRHIEKDGSITYLPYKFVA